MKSNEEILDAINEYPVDIWGNPQRPDDMILDACEYCGRKHGKDPLMFHVNTDGTILPNTITEEDLQQVGMESQGAFPIGRTCAKKLFGNRLHLYAL